MTAETLILSADEWLAVSRAVGRDLPGLHREVLDVMPDDIRETLAEAGLRGLDARGLVSIEASGVTFNGELGVVLRVLDESREGLTILRARERAVHWFFVAIGRTGTLTQTQDRLWGAVHMTVLEPTELPGFLQDLVGIGPSNGLAPAEVPWAVFDAALRSDSSEKSWPLSVIQSTGGVSVARRFAVQADRAPAPVQWLDGASEGLFVVEPSGDTVALVPTTAVELVERLLH